MRNSTISVRPLSSALGAEIGGLDLRTPLSDAARDEIRQALADNGVVFFRDQDLTSEQYLAFGLKFGKPEPSRYSPTMPGIPQITTIKKEATQKANIGGSWHTDRAYNRSPAYGTILIARDLPPYGGDTLFLSMAKVYESLSDGLKRTLQGLKAVHSNAHVFGPKAKPKDNGMKNTESATQETSHPVVKVLPENGRKVLYVNPAYTVKFDGWTEEESRPLLDYLFRHAQRPEFQYRFTWKPGSIAFWDNRQCWHYAMNDYIGHRREMHRMALLDENAVAEENFAVTSLHAAQ